jgi:hypothetical protein
MFPIVLYSAGRGGDISMSLDIFSTVGAVLGLMGTTYPTRNIRSTAELIAASHGDATLNDASVLLG